MPQDELDIGSALGPHYAVLFRATKYRPTTRDREEICRLIRSGIDWEPVLRLARGYDVASLLYYHLKEPGWRGIIPAEILAGLKEEYAAVCSLNLAYYQELGRLLRIFAAHGIEVLLLKGAALAQLLYPDIGLRAFGDVDLLIRPEHLGRVDEIMQSEYQLETPLPADRLRRKCYFHLAYKRRRTPTLSFEFHWNFYSAEGLIDFDISRLWHGVRHVELSAARVLIPSPENLFLHLCLHFSGHWFLAVKDLWDVEWMVSSPGNPLDWEQIVTIAKTSGLGTRVYYALYFAHRLLGTRVEAWIWSALQPPALTRRLFPLILDERKVLNGEAEREKDIRAVIALFLYQGKVFKFLRRLLYPGVCWLSVYPDEPCSRPLIIKLKNLLRGIRLWLYIAGRLIMGLFYSVKSSRD
jgi:hypothetical protein